MTEYGIVRSGERTYIFARECDRYTHIEIDVSVISPEEVLLFVQTNHVAPEHLAGVYEDLIFAENMV